MRRMLRRAFQLAERAAHLSPGQAIEELARRVLPRMERVPYGPRNLLVEVTQYCNFTCGFCLRGKREGKSGKEIHFSPSLLTDILKQYPRIMNVNFAGLGEPLLNPALPEMVRECKRRGMKTSLITNGSARFEKWVEILSGGLGRLCVSIKALDSDEFRNITGQDVAMQQLVLENTRALADYARSRKSVLDLSIAYVVWKNRLDDIEAVVSLAESIGVERVELQNLIPSEEGEFQINSALLQEDADTVLRLEKLRRRLKRSRVQITWPVLVSAELKPSRPLSCDWYWRTIRVDVQGNFNACGRVYLPKANSGSIVGSPGAFNSEHFVEWRNMMLYPDRAMPQACEWCVENFGKQQGSEVARKNSYPDGASPV